MAEEKIPFIRNDLFKVPDSKNEKPYLIGSKCNSCERVFFPRRSICPDCRKENTMSDLPLSSKGTVRIGVIAHTAPLGFKPPYAMAWIDLPEGVRIFSPVVDDELLRQFLIPGTDSLQSGFNVELVIEKIREDDEGNDVMGYKFKALKNN